MQKVLICCRPVGKNLINSMALLGMNHAKTRDLTGKKIRQIRKGKGLDAVLRCTCELKTAVKDGTTKAVRRRSNTALNIGAQGR